MAQITRPANNGENCDDGDVGGDDEGRGGKCETKVLPEGKGLKRGRLGRVEG